MNGNTLAVNITNSNDKFTGQLSCGPLVCGTITSGALTTGAVTATNQTITCGQVMI